MSKVITVNMLGETAKQQWDNTIAIYRMVIDSNLSRLRDMADDEEYDEDDEEYWEDVFAGDDKGMEYLNILDGLERTINNVFYEMNRLVDALYAEE